jgi:hypothetical protein
MDFFDKIKGWWRGKNTEAVLVNDENNSQNIFLETTQDFTEVEPLKNTAENQEVAFPHWLSNEDALRDEGVIFGLSDTPASEKINIITSFFDQKISHYKKKFEELSERINEVNLVMEKLHNESEELKKKSLEVEASEYQFENFWRVMIGLFLSIGMAVGNYFLIRASIRQNFPTEYEWVALGVFLTGMFSLFNPKSILHHQETKISWKTAVEELGIPAAAAIFVLVNVIEKMPFYQSIGLFLFVFFVFLVSGKVLLSNVSQLKEQWSIFNKNIILKKNKYDAANSWKIQLKQNEEKIEELRVKKWRIIPDLNENEAIIQKINAEKETLIHIFKSEYHLAQSFKSKLSGLSLKNILGE